MRRSARSEGREAMVGGYRGEAGCVLAEPASRREVFCMCGWCAALQQKAGSTVWLRAPLKWHSAVLVGTYLGRAAAYPCTTATRSFRLSLDTLNGARTLPAVVSRSTVGGALAAGLPPAGEECCDEVDDGLPGEVEENGDEAEEDDDDDGYADAGAHFENCT